MEGRDAAGSGPGGNMQVSFKLFQNPSPKVLLLVSSLDKMGSKISCATKQQILGDVCFLLAGLYFSTIFAFKSSCPYH
jgi:hypothetical protein